MSLSYDEMYNISGGIYVAFKNNKDKSVKTFTINHGQKKRESMKVFFPMGYETWTRENFIIANLYIQFNNSPSSLISSFETLKNTPKQSIMKFKDEILMYRKYLIEDIERIKLYETKIDANYIINEYVTNKVKWYTFYFYVMYSGLDIGLIEKSRINKFLLIKIKKLLLYVTFSEKSASLIKTLINDSIKFD